VKAAADPVAGLAALAAGPYAYAIDDGMAFPGWTPPLLSDDEARTGYEAGERVAVLAGEPQDPGCGVVLDRRNARLAVRLAEPDVQLVYAGGDPVLAEARWRSGDIEHWGRRQSAGRLQISTRTIGQAIWADEWFAARPAEADPGLPWPAFGEWPDLAERVRGSAPGWIADGGLDLVDADGWMLEAMQACGVLTTWAELGEKYDAPRAFGLPAEVHENLAGPLGWHAAGRKWRLADAVTGPAGESVTVTSDAVFTAGAGASGEIVTTVEAGPVSVTLDLPTATARSRQGVGGSYPRPSTGAQVAVTAILEAGLAAHGAVIDAVRAGRLPQGWRALPT
jgi:hypothetical protein